MEVDFKKLIGFLLSDKVIENNIPESLRLGLLEQGFVYCEGEFVKLKFKIGDKVKEDDSYLTHVVKDISDDCYKLVAIAKDGTNGQTVFSKVKYQDQWKLVENGLDSEEYIRKWIIEDLKDSISNRSMSEDYVDKVYTAIAWLEDKKEDKHGFKPGEWIVNDSGTVYKVLSQTPKGYVLSMYNDDYRPFETDLMNQNSCHLWTIEDAKPGDVLSYDNSIFIFKEEYMCGKPQAYCGIMNGLFRASSNGCWTNEKCYPATLEHRKILFNRIAKEGYEWDSEKLELKKIEEKYPHIMAAYDKATIEYIIEDIKELRDNETDEGSIETYDRELELLRNINNWIQFTEDPEIDSDYEYSEIDSVIALLDVPTAISYPENRDRIKELIFYLKCIKKRFADLAKQTWTQEDEENSTYIVAALDAYYQLRKERNNTSAQDKLDNAIEWIHNRFKTLKSNEVWRPSEKQMNILWDVLNNLKHDNYKHTDVIKLLYLDLKKL